MDYKVDEIKFLYTFFAVLLNFTEIFIVLISVPALSKSVLLHLSGYTFAHHYKQMFD